MDIPICKKPSKQVKFYRFPAVFSGIIYTG